MPPILNFVIKICIIKLGALGDVVRTTSILEAIKEKYPTSEITWITKPMSKEILTENPNINQILTINDNIGIKFDILYNFDIEQDATKLALQIKADKKYGYYDNGGFPASFNESAEYYLNTVFDDNLKKSNRKSYQEMIFETAELEYKNQKPKLFISEQAKQFAENFIKENNLIDKKIIGLNIGSSERWPSKAWHIEKIKEFIIKAKEKKYEVILLGADNEEQAKQKLISGFKVYFPETSDSLKKLFAIINICDKIVTADSLVLHTALAFNKPTIGLFFCSTPYEIEGYNSLTKIISPMFEQFFPEKMNQYNEELVKSIGVKQVINSLG